jgi:hypothetical protein
MVVEIALGADPPHDIAWRYGLTRDEYDDLAALDWFVELIARKRQDLQDNGFLFQTKAAMMAEALLTSLFQQAMAQKVAAPVAIEISKQLVDIGRLKPIPGVTVPGASGPGFAINIQINQADGAAPTTLVAADLAAPREAPPPVLDVEFSPSQPVSPAHQSPGASPGSTGGGKPQGPLLPKPPPYISNLKVPNLDRDCRPSLAGTPATQAAVAAGAPQTTSPGLQSPGARPGGIGLPRKP